MLDLVTAAISLANSICSFIATESLLSYPKKLAVLQQELLNEKAKGYQSDDAKIENLYSEINITIGAIQNEIAMLQAGKAGTPSASSTVAGAAGTVSAAVK